MDHRSRGHSYIPLFKTYYIVGSDPIFCIQFGVLPKENFYFDVALLLSSYAHRRIQLYNTVRAAEWYGFKAIHLFNEEINK